MPSRQSFCSADDEPRLLQGTFEKIHFQTLFGESALQQVILLPELDISWIFFAGLALCLIRRGRLRVIPPAVQRVAIHSEFLRQRGNVVTTRHTLNRHATELS